MNKKLKDRIKKKISKKNLEIIKNNLKLTLTIKDFMTYELLETIFEDSRTLEFGEMKKLTLLKKLKNKKELAIHKLLTLKNILTITAIILNIVQIYKFFKGL